MSHHQMEIAEPSKDGSTYAHYSVSRFKMLRELDTGSLKLRFWIDFGQRKQYNVEWMCKLDSNSNLVEIVIKVDYTRKLIATQVTVKVKAR